MKKVFKIFAYGLIGLIGLSLVMVIVILPSKLEDVSGNMKWLWLYTPHVIALLVLIGWIIYTEIDET